jgi:hypothetical protein
LGTTTTPEDPVERTDATPPVRGGRAVPPLLDHLVLALIFLALAAVMARYVVPEVLRGALVDTDAYMRLVRVRELAETGRWFDASVPRSNWPYGETLHWTRPLDALLLLGTWLVTPLFGFERALHLAGVFASPLLLLAICFATGWAGRPFTGPTIRWIAWIAVLVQPIVVAYGFPGRPDHHALILLAFVLAFGAAVRALEEPGRARWAVGAGVAAGVGLWVSPEFLIALAVLLLGGVLAWILAGEPYERVALRFTASLAASTAAALLLERGLDLAPIAYERISVVHVVVTGLAVGFWSVAGALGSRKLLVGRRSRMAAAAAGGAICLTLLGIVFREFYRGPMVDFRHPLVRFWLSRVSELRPLLLPVDADGRRMFLVNVGSSLFLVPFFAARVWRARGRDLRGGHLLMGIALAAFFPLALYQVRWVTYVQLLLAILLAELIAVVRETLRRRAPRGLAHLARAACTAALLGGPLSLALWATGHPEGLGQGLGGEPGVAPPGALGGAAPGADEGPDEPSLVPPCDFAALARYLADDPGLGARPRTVAALMDAGPALLYLSRHRVLSTPYGNESGLVASHELLNATDDVRARAVAAEREVDLLLLCPSRERGFFVPVTAEGDSTLYGRLLDGRPPDWIEPLALPDSLRGARLFGVWRPGG